MIHNKDECVLFWFRRDLRLEDNHALYQALKSGKPVQALFIFDKSILQQLDKTDARLPFIHSAVEKMKKKLQSQGSDLWIFHDHPEDVWPKILSKHRIAAVYANHDYEPAARNRDRVVAEVLSQKKVPFYTYKDQVIFEKSEVLADSAKPYTVYTPYKKKWLAQLDADLLRPFKSEDELEALRKGSPQRMPSLEELGFLPRPDDFYPDWKIRKNILVNYQRDRDFPERQATSHLGIHLRFGTVSVRKLVALAKKEKFEVWLSELIWREFFMQILWHFPHVEKSSFRPAYEKVAWRKNKEEFARWCQGQTGYPIVDAGMRELNQTGFMHNRVRMIVASFLTKHLLMHWLLGERYFASKLLDYDLSANNGNWQWAAGTGCDAAPYFRIFNPETQTEKFDPQHTYLKKWVPEYQTPAYPKPMVEHKFARERALAAFKAALNKDS